MVCVRGQALRKHSIKACYCHNYHQIQSHRLSRDMPWRRQVRGDMVLASGTLGFGGRLVGWDLSICPGCNREGQVRHRLLSAARNLYLGLIPAHVGQCPLITSWVPGCTTPMFKATRARLWSPQERSRTKYPLMLPIGCS